MRSEPRLGWLLGACGAAALCATFAGFCGVMTGDLLLPVLVSTLKWTPFYWAQDRFGMLVPLLAWPLRHPLHNLLFQYTLLITATLAAPLLLARYAGLRAWALAGIATGVLWLALVPAPHQALLVANPYALSLCLGVGGLLWLERGGRLALAAALVLSALAAWVNASVVLFTLPLVLFRAGLEAGGTERWRRARPPGGLALFSGVFGYALTRLASERTTKLNPASPGEWLDGWSGLAVNSWLEFGLPVFVVLAVALVGAAMQLRSDQARKGVALIATCALYFVIVGTLGYVKLNDYSSRYVAPIFLALPSALFGLALQRVVLSPRATTLLAVATLLAASLFGWGAPSPSRPRAELERLFRPNTRAALDAKCTFVAGNYFTVWPMQFLEDLHAADEGREPALWAVTHRASALVERWKTVEPRRLCAVAGDPDGPRWLAELGLTSSEVTSLSLPVSR